MTATTANPTESLIWHFDTSNDHHNYQKEKRIIQWKAIREQTLWLEPLIEASDRSASTWSPTEDSCSCILWSFNHFNCMCVCMYVCNYYLFGQRPLKCLLGALMNCSTWNVNFHFPPMLNRCVLINFSSSYCLNILQYVSMSTVRYHSQSCNERSVMWLTSFLVSETFDRSNPC